MNQQGFDDLFQLWYNETCFHSNPYIIMRHHAFQSIFDVGADAIPFVLDKLQKGDGCFYLCMMLQKITGENPAPDPEKEGGFVKYNVQATIDAWIQWGINKGLIYAEVHKNSSN